MKRQREAEPDTVDAAGPERRGIPYSIFGR
jgi:hypothetical protein